jgi:hypothetical protein
MTTGRYSDNGLPWYAVEVAPFTYKVYFKDTNKEFDVVETIMQAFADGNLKTSTKRGE